MFSRGGAGGITFSIKENKRKTFWFSTQTEVFCFTVAPQQAWPRGPWRWDHKTPVQQQQSISAVEVSPT